MALIPIEEISELKPASDVKDVADTALDLIEEGQVARAINLAANTGEHSVVWEHPLSDTLRKKLNEKGYTIKVLSHIADPTKMYEIGGF